MTAIFRMLPWPSRPPAQAATAPIDHPTTPAGKFVYMESYRRRAPLPFDLEAMSMFERMLLSYALRTKPLTEREYASFVRLCRAFTSGE